MLDREGILRELARGSGWIIRVAVLGAVLAGALSFAVPPLWESRAVLLPPEREAANFRYDEWESSWRGALGAMAVRTAIDPIDAWRAVLAAPETARRLVRRFSLTETWGGGSEAQAVAVLQGRLRLEEIPWGPIELRVTTSDRRLSADLANAAVEVLRERLSELYREDVEWERTFLREASRRQIEAAAGTEATLAAARAASGVADEALQERSAASAAQDRAVELARARTERARAAIRYGPSSPRALDAERRVRELERAGLPHLPLPPAGSDAAAEEAGDLEDLARRMARLWFETVQQEASHEFALKVLDPAVPADRPDRPLGAALALALLLVPASFAGTLRLRRELDALPSGTPGLATLRARSVAAGRWLRGTRSGAIVAAAVAGAVAAGLAREPLAIAAAGGAVFLLVVAVDLRAAWLVLFAALPWAWDYMNLRWAFAVQIPTEPGIIVLVGAWAYVRLLRPRPLRPTPLVVAMGLLIAWTVVCTVTSVDPRNSVFQTVAVTGFILAGGVFPVVELRTPERVELVLRILLVNAALASLIGIGQVATSRVAFGRAAFHIGEGFLYNHGPYAAFLGFAMGPAFVLLLTERWSRRSLPVLVVAMLVTTATVVAISRAGWLSTIVLLAAFAIARGRLFLRKLAVPIILVAAVLVIGFLRSPFALQGFTSYVEKSTEEDYGSNVDRLQRYAAALRMLRDRPITGVGPGAYESAYDRYRSVDFETGWRGAHSEPLRAAAEQGVPGLLLLAFLVVTYYRTGLRLMRRARDPRIRRLATCLCAGMLTYTVHGLVNEYWRVTKIAFVMWVFVGMLGALDRMSREQEGEPPAAPRAA